MKDWLIKRLTPRKKQEERWTGLTDGLQQVWEEGFDPALARLESLRSYFLASDADLALKLREMGDYFAADMPRPEDRAIAVAWRRLELEYKDLELILFSVFRRHFGNLPVTWFPLFAPLDEDYGMAFIPAEGPWPEQKNIPPDGMFLTSRGMLGTDYGHLLKLGISKGDFLDRALPLLKRTKPLHIVYDGPLWYIRWDIPFECDFSAFWERDDWIEIPFTVVGAHFDFTDADVRFLDTNTMSDRREVERWCEFEFLPHDYPWHLDFFLPEGFPESWLSLDTLIHGNEAVPGPMRLVATDTRRQPSVALAPASLSPGWNATSHTPCLKVRECRAFTQCEASHSLKIELAHSRHPIDHYPRFDDFPADRHPLDMPIGGFHVG